MLSKFIWIDVIFCLIYLDLPMYVCVCFFLDLYD
jgi:hypothetical protein